MGTSARLRISLPDRAGPLSAALLCALAAAPDAAHASGFAVREQSGSALGSAFAGASASASDLSYMFFNPAQLMRVPDGGQVALLVTNYISPRNELLSASGSTVSGAALGGTAALDDIGENAATAAIYGLWEVDPDFKLGLGINLPFGLETDYANDWVGRYHALNSQMLNINVNPAAAVRLTDRLSLGAGLQVSYLKARLTNAVDFGTIAFVQTAGALGVPGRQDGFGDVEGDDIGFGYTAGLLFEPVEGTRLGLGLRSKISHEIRGDAHFVLDAAGTAATLQGLSSPTPFVDTGAKASATLPETASLGLHHDIDDTWSVMAEAAWTRWSRFQEIRVRFDNPGQPDNVTETAYHDTWFFALGAEYRWSDAWTLRAGTAYDRSPISDEHRTPRIPDEDRYWIAFGASYQPHPDLTLDLSYAHNFIGESTVNLTTGGAGNTFRGNLSARYDNAVDLFAVQLKYRF